MSADKGPAFLLKVGDGGTPPTFATVAGLRLTAFSINREAVGVDQGKPWLELATEGDAAVSVSGRGIFTGSAAETRIKGNALAGLVDDYELSFESGEHLRGSFLLTRLDYTGDRGGERTYSLTLESSGPVVAA